MTPQQLLEGVKSRFPVLLVTEPETLEAKLIQALSAYQDIAGLTRRVKITKEAGESLPYPEDYLSLVLVTDKRGGLVYSDDFGTAIEMDLVGSEQYPLTLTYLANLRDRPLDKWDVPPVIISIIQDYLEVLISIPNAERLRRVSIAGKLDTSTIPDENTLYQRKLELEASMRAHQAVFSGATIIGG